MTPDPAFVKQALRVVEAEAAARKAWDLKDKETKKLVRLSGLGRKSSVTIPISENRGLRITDKWRAAMRNREQKIFAPAFSHRHEVKEVALDSD